MRIKHGPPRVAQILTVLRERETERASGAEAQPAAVAWRRTK